MRLSAKTRTSVGIAFAVWGLTLAYLFTSLAWGEALHQPTAIEIDHLQPAAPSADTPPPEPAVERCTTTDLHRPLPPMPRAKRVVTKYVVDTKTHINPAPNVRPHVSARTAWRAAKRELTSATSATYPPGGGTGSILFGQVASSSTVPSIHRLAWVVILHHTALNVLPRGVRRSPPPNPPCYFGQAYIAVDTTTGKWFLSGAQPVIPNDTTGPPSLPHRTSQNEKLTTERRPKPSTSRPRTSRHASIRYWRLRRRGLQSGEADYSFLGFGVPTASWWT